MASSRKANKSKAESASSWLSEAEEVPSDHGMKYVKRSFTARTWRIIVGSTLLLLPFSFLGNVVSLGELLNEDTTPVALNQNTSPNKSVAMGAVVQWLKATPSPLPGGSLLSWDSVENLSQPAITFAEDGSIATNTPGIEIHSLTVKQGDSGIFSVGIQIAYSDTAGAKVIAAPSLTPRIPDRTGGITLAESWPGHYKARIADPMSQSAKMWAESLFSADPNALRLALGDTSESNFYMPMPLATITNVSVEDAAAADLEYDPTTGEPPTTVIARVSIGIKWPGSEDKLEGKTPPRVAYDVLMTGAEAGAPRVVAWGPTGSGASLKPFGNAQTTREITDQDTLKVAETPADEKSKK